MLTAGSTDRQEAVGGAGSRLPTLVGSVVFVVIATIAQLLRQSGTSMWHTVWAEDGALFYSDALNEPLREVVLRPYAGYALVVPRVLASVGVHLPIEWYSYFAAISAALIAALLALFVYFASAPLLRSPVRQGVLAGALLLWPVLPFEISGVIANTHWVMPIPCLLAVLMPVTRPTAVAVRVVVVVFAALSSPLCVLFVPIAMWHLVGGVTRHANRARLIVPIALTAAAGVQLAVWLTAEQASRTEPSQGAFISDAIRLYGTRVTTEFVFGARSTAHLWGPFGYWLAALSAFMIGVAVAWKWRRATWTSRWFIGICVVASGAIFALTLSQRSDIVAAMVVASDASYIFLAPRYQLFPAALLLLALLVPVDLPRGAVLAGPTQPPPRARLVSDIRKQRSVIAIAAVWVLVAFAPSFRLTTARSVGPDWGASVAAAEDACLATDAAVEVLPISPAPDWLVVVPCSELEG